MTEESINPPHALDAANRIDANPTKEFFIEMITRDIGLSHAVADLVDNSIDAARRMRGNESLDGLWVRIGLDENRFTIRDNCGGMSISTARNYAFRFGRDESDPTSPHSIGRFGVGMKRAIFKMGREFQMLSRTQSESFRIHVDIDDWEKAPDWAFSFAETGFASDSDLSDSGVLLEVMKLNTGTREDFSNPERVAELRNKLRLTHQLQVGDGLELSVNGQVVEPTPMELLRTNDIQPARWFHSWTGQEFASPVEIDVLVGIAPPTTAENAGWNLFCNDRLVLHADRTERTGWGVESKLPRYHNQYSRFKGFVFFNSEDSAAVPWTTTKDDVDHNSPVFRYARNQMLNMMRPVIQFLNELDKEKDISTRRLTNAVQAAETSPVSIKELMDESLPKLFTWPKQPKQTRRPSRRKITFNKPVSLVDEALIASELGSPNELGSTAFDYYLVNELDMDPDESTNG